MTKSIVLKYLQQVEINKHCQEMSHSIICDITRLNDILLDHCEVTDHTLRIPVNYTVKVCTPMEQDKAYVKCHFDSGLFATNCCKNVFVVNGNDKSKCSKKGDVVYFEPYYWKIGFRQSESKYIFLILCHHAVQ